MHPHPEDRGQSTVEFALVLPLFMACTALLVGTTVVCLQFVALHDTARAAARAAATSDRPDAAARAAVTDGSVSITVTQDHARDLVTVTARRSSGVWWFARVLPVGVFSRSVTMLREAPIVLGDGSVSVKGHGVVVAPFAGG